MTSRELSGSAGGTAPEDKPAWRSRGYLPHFDRAGVVQMITYRLAWVIMPNHVHAIVEMENPAWGLSTVVQAWKSYTAKATNRVPGWDGLFWQPEYYDRAIRDVRHLAPAVAYGAESRGKSASGGNS